MKPLPLTSICDAYFNDIHKGLRSEFGLAVVQDIMNAATFTEDRLAVTVHYATGRTVRFAKIVTLIREDAVEQE